jgi:transcription elongation GreA/GreB family factor
MADTKPGQLYEVKLIESVQPAYKIKSELAAIRYLFTQLKNADTEITTEKLDDLKIKIKKINRQIKNAKVGERIMERIKKAQEAVSTAYKAAKLAIKGVPGGAAVAIHPEIAAVVQDIDSINRKQFRLLKKEFRSLFEDFDGDLAFIEEMISNAENKNNKDQVMFGGMDEVGTNYFMAKKDGRLVEFWQESESNRTWVNDKGGWLKYNEIQQEARLRGLYPIQT